MIRFINIVLLLIKMRFLIKEAYEGKNQTNLSKRDLKLIQLLVQNSRTPISLLAQKLGVSKAAISMRIKTLQEKGILSAPAFYYKLNIKGVPKLYMCEISTEFGLDRSIITEKLLKIHEVSTVIWFNANYNLLLLITAEDAQQAIDKVGKIIQLNKVRLRRAINNWFHPPHICQEINDVKVESTFEKEFLIDEFDKKLLQTIEKNPTATLLELSQSLRCAPLRVKKRLIFLQEKKMIVGFSYHINYWACGFEVISIPFSVYGREKTNEVIKELLKFPQTSNVWEFDYESNLGVVLWVKEQNEVSNILEKMQKKFPEMRDIEISVMTGIKGK